MTCGDAARHAGDGVCWVGMALVMIMKVLRATCSSRRTMPRCHHRARTPTYALVDQFDEDEFPDIPKAPAALLAALNTVTDPRKPRGLRHSLPAILAIAACAVIAGARSFAVIAGARSFVAIAEWAAAATPAGLAKLGVTGE